MTLQKVKCTNSCQHACNQFALESIRSQKYIQYSSFQQNQFKSKSNKTDSGRQKTAPLKRRYRKHEDLIGLPDVNSSSTLKPYLVINLPRENDREPRLEPHKCERVL